MSDRFFFLALTIMLIWLGFAVPTKLLAMPLFGIAGVACALTFICFRNKL